MLIRRTFQSVGECVRYAQEYGDKHGSSHTGDRGFTETDSFDHACDLALYGWKEERDAIAGVIREVKSGLGDVMVSLFELTRGMEGTVLDESAYLAGDPECLFDFTPDAAQQEQEVIRVLVNGVYRGGTPARQVRERGAAVCALVDLLMSLGKAVEVWTESPVKAEGDTHSILVCLKGASHFIDADDIAFALAHPSMLRRIYFGVNEGESDEVRDRFGFRDGGRYGSCTSLTASSDIGAHVVIEGMLEVQREGGASVPVEWVKETLRELGVWKEED